MGRLDKLLMSKWRLIELVAFKRVIFVSREVKTSSKDGMSLRVLEKGAPMHSVLHFERSEPIGHSRLDQGFHMHEGVGTDFGQKFMALGTKDWRYGLISAVE
jgi:hypothetical protein